MEQTGLFEIDQNGESECWGGEGVGVIRDKELKKALGG